MGPAHQVGALLAHRIGVDQQHVDFFGRSGGIVPSPEEVTAAVKARLSGNAERRTSNAEPRIAEGGKS